MHRQPDDEYLHFAVVQRKEALAYLFAHKKIMEQLRKTYSEQRVDYSRVLKEALQEKDTDRMNAYSLNLVDLNQKMSTTVSSMVNLVAQTESKVNLDALRDKLLAELVGIQKDIKEIQNSYGDRKVLQSIHDQYSFQNTRNDWTIMAYLVALGIGMILVTLVVLKNSFLSPAVLPISMPSLTSAPQGLL